MKERKAIIEKKRMVEELSNVAQQYPVLAIIKLKNLPDFIFQGVRKELKKKNSFVKVAKLAVIKRVLKAKGLDEMAEKLDIPSALVLTSLQPFHLASLLREHRKKVPAKPGQIAPFDIVVPAGDTGLPPGPALTELKQAGLPVQIKGGKIAITKDHVLVKEGEAISDIQAKVLQKLDILPFEAGAELLFAFDGTYIYSPELLSWTKEQMLEEISSSLTNALNLSINANYPTQQNISVLLASAITRGRNLAANAWLPVKDSLPLLLAMAAKQGMAIGEKVNA
jgi:large subunit ribosomal protein L10